MIHSEAYGSGEEGWQASDTVCIRLCRPADVPAFWTLDRVGHLLADATDGAAAASNPPGAVPECREDQLWVAEVEGRVIGTVGIACDGPHVAELRHLRVEPGWRDRGIARRLVATAAREARELGYLKLLLEGEMVTERATQVLESLGFQYVGDRHTGGRRVMQFYLDLYGRRRQRSLTWA